MTTAVIMDAIVVIILVVAVCYGAKRGLLESLAGLIIVVMALVGAGIAAGTFTEPVAGFVTPLVEERVAERVEAALEEQAGAFAGEWSLEEVPDLEELPIAEVLALMGLDETVRASLAERAQNMIRDTGATVVSAVVESLVRSFVYGVLFFLAFLTILLLLKVLVGAMGLVLKLPGLRLLNALGGAVIGLAEGVLLLFLAVWLCRKLGVSFETEALAEAHILRIFTTNTPLSLLSFLQ